MSGGAEPLDALHEPSDSGSATEPGRCIAPEAQTELSTFTREGGGAQTASVLVPFHHQMDPGGVQTETIAGASDGAPPLSAYQAAEAFMASLGPPPPRQGGAPRRAQ